MVKVTVRSSLNKTPIYLFTRIKIENIFGGKITHTLYSKQNCHSIIRLADTSNHSSRFSDLIYTRSSKSTYFVCKIPEAVNSKSNQYIVPSLNNNDTFSPFNKHNLIFQKASKLLSYAIWRQALFDNKIYTYCSLEAPQQVMPFSLWSTQGKLLISQYSEILNLSPSKLQQELLMNPVDFQNKTREAWVIAEKYHITHWKEIAECFSTSL